MHGGGQGERGGEKEEERGRDMEGPSVGFCAAGLRLLHARVGHGIMQRLGMACVSESECKCVCGCECECEGECKCECE